MARRAKRSEKAGRRGDRWTPLDDAERARLEQAVGRVAQELARVLASLGAAARPSELERRTRLGRATIHRVLALAKTEPGGELRALDGAPGPEALEAFLKALGPRTLTSKLAGEVRLAIAQYERALIELGGSQATVRARARAIRATVDADPEARERRQREIREQLFHHVAEFLGRQSDVRIDMMLFRPSDARASVLDFAQVRGIVGYRGRADSLPLTVDLLGRALRPEGAPEPTLLDLDGRPAADRLSSTLLAEFSTSPPPIVLSQGLGARVRNIVDPAFLAGGLAVDFFVGFQRRSALQHPSRESPPNLSVGALHRDPARHLLIDVYLERSLVAGAVPDLSAYVWSPTLETSLADHWTDRLPLREAAIVLGPGLSRARTAAYARHDALTRHVFERLGWDAAAFIGFRAEIAYPLWGGAYFLTFDYAPAATRPRRSK